MALPIFVDTIGYEMDISGKISEKLLFDNTVYFKIGSYLSQIDVFKGSWMVIEGNTSGYLRELRKIATVESIGSSTRIEGATLTDEEVDKLLRSVKVDKLTTRDQQEVMGYYDALEVILDNYSEIELSERYLHQLHSILLRYSDKDARHKGGYKMLSNKVVANYPDGSQRTIFRTTEPHLTAVEMQELIGWTIERFAEKDMHPVLVIAVFVYEFLSIHPYQDGNGRLSRLLATLLLMQQGYHFAQYISFEHVIEATKEEYYRALMDGQKNRHTPEEKIDKWLFYFLGSMVILTERLDAKYKMYSKLSLDLNERQKRLMEIIRENRASGLKAIEEALGDYSRNTLKKDLAWLVREGLLIKTGTGRGVRYHFVEKISGK